MSVEIFEGDRASNYDDFVDTWIPGYHKFVSLIPDLLLNEQFNHTIENVLIAGCGTGNEIEILAKASAGWQLTGIDPSPEMIAQARQKLMSYPNVNLIEGVVADLPTHPNKQSQNGQPYNKQPQNKRYDAATLILVLHFLEDNGDKVALLKEISTRLKPQSPLITFDIIGSHQHIQQNLSVLASLLPKDIDKEIVKFRLDRIQHSLYHVTEQRFIELCHEAGFETPIRFFQSTIYMGWILTKRK